MNGIIALCHFCELHGPSILFCTQAFHSQEPQPVADSEPGQEARLTYISRDRERYVRCPSVVSSAFGETADKSTPTLTKPKVADFCEACRSIQPGQPGFISNDHDAKVSYVSLQYPDHPEVFSMVRQACVRSLSCEVCPGREGPIFFGDDHRGHVFSHTFFIKDSQARGFQRWYSIIVVMMDRIFLLNSWPFLVGNIRSIIDEIEAKANKVYEEEQAKCPQRAHRLTMSMTPENFRQQRGGSKPARSLIELTRDKVIFRKLHQNFTWILKAGGNRLTERLLEGPPTEDSIIDWEKQEETEEGFVKLFSKKLVMEEKSEEGLETEEEEREESNVPVFTNLRHLLKVLGYTRFHALAYHVVIGNQVIIHGRSRALVRSIIDCLKQLLPKGCCRLIYFSNKYEDSWRCNFLGLQPGTALPAHADLYISVDVIEPENEVSHDDDQSIADCFSGYNFLVESKSSLPEKGPAVLYKMEFSLMNDSLADSVVDQCLVCLKEEWMNKVKVLFKFTKAGGQRSDEDTRKLLQVVGAQNEDRAVLKFWMTGLSVQYRNHMLSSAISQSVSS